MNKTLKIAIIVDDVLISDYLAELIIWSKSIDSVEISNYLFLVSDEKDVLRMVSDFNFKEDGTIDEYGNSTIIPKCVIYDIKEVK